MEETPDGLDRRAIEMLRRLGGARLLRQMVDSFRSHAVGRVEGALRGVAKGDAAAVRIATHTLKSSAGQLGAATLSGLCAEAETISARGSLEGIPELVSRIASELKRVEGLLEEECAREG